MIHVVYTEPLTHCRMVFGRPLPEGSEKFLRPIPVGDSTTTDLSKSDCQECIKNKIAEDDHARWNMQFFSPDGSSVIRDGQFNDPEPEEQR